MTWAFGWVLLGFLGGLVAGRRLWFSPKVREDHGAASIEGGRDDGHS